MKDDNQLETYTEDGVEFSPEWSRLQVSRSAVSGMIHHMTVCDTSEWDEVMHPQVNRLKVGETTTLESEACEYLKVTKTNKDTFDAEYGMYDTH